MPDAIRIEIATPEAVVNSSSVDMVTLPAIQGKIGVLPHHIRLIAQLVPGEMTVRKKSTRGIPRCR